MPLRYGAAPSSPSHHPPGCTCSSQASRKANRPTTLIIRVYTALPSRFQTLQSRAWFPSVSSSEFAVETQSIVVALSFERSDPQEGHVCEPPSLFPSDNPGFTSWSVVGNAAHSSVKVAFPEPVEANLPQVLLHFSLLRPVGGGSAATVSLSRSAPSWKQKAKPPLEQSYHTWRKELREGRTPPLSLLQQRHYLSFLYWYLFLKNVNEIL